jgi:hypothetical protein
VRGGVNDRQVLAGQRAKRLAWHFWSGFSLKSSGSITHSLQTKPVEMMPSRVSNRWTKSHAETKSARWRRNGPCNSQ